MWRRVIGYGKCVFVDYEPMTIIVALVVVAVVYVLFWHK